MSERIQALLRPSRRLPDREALIRLVKSASTRLRDRRALIRAGTGLLATAGLGYGLLHTELFAVEELQVVGTTHLSAEEVLVAAHLKKGNFLIDIRESKIEHRLETNPWVREASVTRSWPHKVSVHVTERVPLAIAQTADKRWAVIGDEGIVLSIVSTLPQEGGLPNALGVEAPTTAGSYLDDKASDLIAVASSLPESLAPRVVQMDKTDKGLRLGLDSGTIVELGEKDNLGAKLTAAAAVIARNDASKIAILDVRSPETPLATPVQTARVSTSTTKSNLSTKLSSSTKPSTTPTKPSTTTSSVVVKR